MCFLFVKEKVFLKINNFIYRRSNTFVRKGEILSLIKNLICRKGNFELNIPFWEWPDKGISALSGPNGSGKSTLAFSLCGLHPVEKGFEWIFKGQNLALLPPPKRKISFLFQSLELFSNMSAEQNIFFPARAQKIPKTKWKERFALLRESLQLSGVLKKPVRVLSGGEKQRTALARALMVKSDFLILDEPFSSLDPELKSRAMTLLKNLQAQDKTPVLLISHSEKEVKLLADRAFYLKAGRIVS